MIWRNEQAELQFPADAPDDAPKQVPANTRVCLVGGIDDDGKGQSLVPLGSALLPTKNRLHFKRDDADHTGGGGPIRAGGRDFSSILIT